MSTHFAEGWNVSKRVQFVSKQPAPWSRTVRLCCCVITLVVLALAAPQRARADIDKSFDWPDMKRKLTVRVETDDADKMLGDIKVKDAASTAITQLNLDKADTKWEWELTTAATADITVRVKAGLDSGGSNTDNFANKDKDGKLKGGLVISVDPSPKGFFGGSEKKTVEWGTTGADKLDPISVLMHELLHTARMDHMPNSAGKELSAGDYFNPILPGEKHTDRRLSAEDKTALKSAASAGTSKDNEAYMGGTTATFAIGEAKMVITDTAIIAGTGFVSLQHLTTETVPDRHEVADSLGILHEDDRVIWGGFALFDGSYTFSSGDIEFTLFYPGHVVDDPQFGNVLESSLRPFVFQPELHRWDPLSLDGFSLDTDNHFGVFRLTGLEAQSHLNLFDNSLIVGLAGEPVPVPEPFTHTLLAIGLAGVLGYRWHHRTRVHETTVGSNSAQAD